MSRGANMSLKTRLDGRSEDNNLFMIKDVDGLVLAKVTLLGNTSSTLEIETLNGLYLEKNNGWDSKGNTKCKQ